jgi:hypothetical protein
MLPLLFKKIPQIFPLYLFKKLGGGYVYLSAPKIHMYISLGHCAMEK